MSKRVLLRCLLLLAALTTLLPIFPFPPAQAQVATVQGSTAPTPAQAQAPGVQDTIPPWPVLSLGAMPGTAPGSVELSWIAPGDDGNAGTATAYVVRYNTVPITETNWISSIDVPGEPVPSPAGSVESMTVSGLAGGQRYYFALKTEDEEANVSGVSNSQWAAARLSPNAVFLPMVDRGFEELPPVIPDTTVVLTDTTIQYLEALSDDGTFTFSQMTPELAELDPGDVLVGDVSLHAPAGFLRKVKSVVPVCDKVVVETEQATLEDAIQTGSFRASQRLTPEQVRTSKYVDGVSMAPSPDGLTLKYSLEDVVLYDEDGNLETDNDQITADGTVSLEVAVDLSVDISWFQVRKVWFTVTADEEAELSVGWKVGYEFEKSVDIFEHTFSPITVMVGVVPVVFVPEMTVSLGVNGEVEVALTAGVAQQAHLVVGAAYENGQWSPINEFSNGFEFNPPALEFSASLEAYAGPEVAFKLYGVGGPNVTLNVFAKVEATIAKAVEVALSAGLKLETGVKIEALGETIAEYDGPSLTWEWLLGEWTFWGNRPPNAPSSPLPIDDAEDEPINVLLQWTGGDIDGDEVTYDVYLEANAPYPDVKVATQTETSFEAGTLQPDTYYYWRIVAQDPDEETTVGPVWSFRTGSAVNNVPTLPSGPIPTNGSTDQSIYPQLRWTGGDPNGDAVTYDVYLAADDNTPDTLVCDDAGSEMCSPGALAMSTEYYWKVVPRDEHGRENPGPVWHFTTGTSENAPPLEPWLVVENGDGPADGATNQDLWTRLYWSCFDPDEDPLTYDVYFEAEDGTPDVLLCSGTAENVCDPGPLVGNTGYYWQVVARDDKGATTAGPVWWFTTADVVVVPEGEFQMGCDACNPQEQCSADELPLHAVSLSPYVIGRTEVTNAQYAACVAAGGCYPPYYNSSRSRSSYYDNPDFADYPVLWVPWQHAAGYCAWAGSSAQASVWRLPTEAEWEKAARGSAATQVYPWGYRDPDCSLSNSLYWDGLSYTTCMTDTAAVGSYPDGASPYGTLDMSGNLWEWVSDWYAGDYYGMSPYQDPPGPSEGSDKVLRGGSWLDLWEGVRAANRSYGEHSEFASDTVGFRCAAVAFEYACSPGPDQISLFVDADYGGQCVIKGIGDYPNPAAIGLPNDAISSVKVGSNVQAVLCEHDNFYGICETFTADDPYLGDNGIGNDMVSSVRVELRPPAMPDGD